MDNFDLYNDIATRTGGDIYVGVVGPVRTGKSTFIKKFMESLVLPEIENKHKKQRTLDELPQSADGKTIMTTEPKFVPNEAVSVKLSDNLNVNVRMIDCVGYLVEGAIGHTENEKPRMVHTPWSDKEMPFETAAEMGTQKVIRDHSTIGVLITTDGSITGLERSKYVEAEERVVNELKSIGKPFVIVLNSKNADQADTLKLRDALEERYDVPVLCKNIASLTANDITEIMEKILLEFPVKLVEATMPKWMQALGADNYIIESVLKEFKESTSDICKMRGYKKLETIYPESEFVESPAEIKVEFGKGRIELKLSAKPDLFYKVLSQECGTELMDDFKLLSYVKYLKYAKNEYDKLKAALDEVSETGYGVVVPTKEQMLLEEPEIVKQGGKFGVRLKASAPSLHIMRVDVETEVNPIVGSEQQSEDLVKYLLSEFENNKNGLWETNMFGKSLDMLVNEGLTNKIQAMPIEARNKMRKTLSRIVNEGKGGVICILL